MKTLISCIGLSLILSSCNESDDSSIVGDWMGTTLESKDEKINPDLIQQGQAFHRGATLSFYEDGMSILSIPSFGITDTTRYHLEGDALYIVQGVDSSLYTIKSLTPSELVLEQDLAVGMSQFSSMIIQTHYERVSKEK